MKLHRDITLYTTSALTPDGGLINGVGSLSIGLDHCQLNVKLILLCGETVLKVYHHILWQTLECYVLDSQQLWKGSLFMEEKYELDNDPAGTVRHPNRSWTMTERWLNQPFGYGSYWFVQPSFGYGSHTYVRIWSHFWAEPILDQKCLQGIRRI